MFTLIRLRNEIFWKFSVFLKFLRFTESLEVKIKIRLAMIRYFFPTTYRKEECGQ